MSETLRQKQSRFVRLKGRLIEHAYAQGYELTDGEAWRTDEQAEIHAMGFAGRERLAKLIEAEFPGLATKIRNNTGNGIRLSLHVDRLAQDFNLFRAGALITNYRPLGEFWERLAPDCRWGGRFGDPAHFSIEHGGRK